MLKTDKLIINDNQIKYNKNESTNGFILSYVDHYVGIKFCPIPFLWNYDDFAQPYPIYGIKKITMIKLKMLLTNNCNNSYLFKNLAILNDFNTDIYVLAQYKNELAYYNTTTNINELYIAYHTWMYTNYNKNFSITKNDKDTMKYRFMTGLFNLMENKIKSIDYNKKILGMPVDNAKLELRQCVIHEHQNLIRFSGAHVCNFIADTDNMAFISIMKYPILSDDGVKQIIMTPQKKTNCVVLHLFRNVADNNPNNNNYQQLIKQFME
jgi:hypothetical protein